MPTTPLELSPLLLLVLVPPHLFFINKINFRAVAFFAPHRCASARPRGRALQGPPRTSSGTAPRRPPAGPSSKTSSRPSQAHPPAPTFTVGARCHNAAPPERPRARTREGESAHERAVNVLFSLCSARSRLDSREVSRLVQSTLSSFSLVWCRGVASSRFTAPFSLLPRACLVSVSLCVLARVARP
jgi:hypothetical protein